MSSINFNNGIYDFKTNTFNKYSQDSLEPSISVGYDYVEYTGDEPIFNEINEYFKKLLHNEQERNKVLQFLSNRIKGIEDNKFNIIYGPASNGKSVFNCLVHKLFGDYYKVIDMSDEEINLKPYCDKRIIVFSNFDTFITMPKIKPFNELECLTTKNCPNPKYQLLIVCNILPEIFDDIKDDFNCRVNIFNFNTTFIKKEQGYYITSNNIEYADFSYEQKIINNEWNAALMWMLIHKY